MWIMIAGPYGHHSESEKAREENLRYLNQIAVEVFKLGHTPIIGVNLALPMIQLAGADYTNTMMPLSIELCNRCDAVLRVGGQSNGADEEVQKFKQLNKPVFFSLEELEKFKNHSLGINHITLSVKSLEVSFDFYNRVMGFKPMMRSQKSAYFLAHDLWFCIEQDEKARSGPLEEYSHIAFGVDGNNFEETVNRIKKSGAKSFKENKSEGLSYYFLDPDGHKLEVHVGNLQTRINDYKRKNINGIEFF